MSSPSTPAGRPPKTMSSRLMTMKFMQRAAASNASSTNSSTKRQRLNDSSPATSLSDAQAIQQALAAEEATRSIALGQQQAEAGETKWEFNFRKEGVSDRGLNVVKVGDVDIAGEAIADGQDEKPWQGAMVGRRSFGKFNRALEKRLNPQAESSSSDDSETDDSANEGNGTRRGGRSDDGDDDPSGSKELIRAARSEAAERAREERKAQKKAAKAEAARLAETRKSKEVKLNRLSSISGRGGGSAGGKSSSANMECYACGKKGHAKKDCPERKPKRERKDEG